MRIPSHTMVSMDAVVGSHEAIVNTAVEAATTSIASFVVVTIMLTSLLSVVYYFLDKGATVTARSTTIQLAIPTPMSACVAVLTGRKPM